MVKLHPIPNQTLEKCKTLELFLSLFVRWRRAKTHWREHREHRPTDQSINELADACGSIVRSLSGSYHMDDIERVSLDVDKSVVEAMKVLVLLILRFALPDGADEDDEDVVFRRPSYFTEDALNARSMNS